MKVIFLRVIPGVGKLHDVKNVADGYAMNFLFPKGYAVRASEDALGKLEVQKKSVQRHQEKERSEATRILKKISHQRFSLLAKSNEEGNLFSSVKPRDLAHALEEKKYHLDERLIMFDAPVKKLGTHRAQIRLHGEVLGEIVFEVVGER